MADPVQFKETLTGDTYTSKLYQELINQIITSISSTIQSSNSTVVRLDFDGNVMFSNNDAVFGSTKESVKTLPGSVFKCTANEILVGDAINKKALVVRVGSKNFGEVIELKYDESNELLTQTDIDFINLSFTNVDVQANISKVIWEYQSDRYITGFYLSPTEIKQVYINDDAIRDSQAWIRQGQTIEWVNQSSKPICVYSGKTNYDQFQLNPNLNLYGTIFKSEFLKPGDTFRYKFVTVGDYDWFVYPDIIPGRITTTRNRINPRDEFVVSENDNLQTPFTSRIIRIDAWGNVLWSFGEGYLVKPRDAKPLLNNGIIIST